MSGMCSLADVKTWLGITDTTKDARLQLLIDTVSAQMVGYLGYEAHYSTYTSERHAINNNQLMYLNAAPIQAVSAVTLAGVTINAGTADQVSCGVSELRSSDSATQSEEKPPSWRGCCSIGLR